MWFYNGEPFTSEMIGDYQGFVYEITDLQTNRKYIGKKFFYSMRQKLVKGKKKRIKSESDWKEYWSSSKQVKDIVESKGKQNLRREILKLCKKKSACNYWELKLQIINDVLQALDENGERIYLNENIALRYYPSNIE
jgi:hypothetical protein